MDEERPKPEVGAAFPIPDGDGSPNNPDGLAALFQIEELTPDGFRKFSIAAENALELRRKVISTIESGPPYQRARGWLKTLSREVNYLFANLKQFEPLLHQVGSAGDLLTIGAATYRNAHRAAQQECWNCVAMLCAGYETHEALQSPPQQETIDRLQSIDITACRERLIRERDIVYQNLLNSAADEPEEVRQHTPKQRLTMDELIAREAGDDGDTFFTEAEKPDDFNKHVMSASAAANKLRLFKRGDPGDLDLGSLTNKGKAAQKSGRRVRFIETGARDLVYYCKAWVGQQQPRNQ